MIIWKYFHSFDFCGWVRYERSGWTPNRRKSHGDWPWSE